MFMSVRHGAALVVLSIVIAGCGALGSDLTIEDPGIQSEFAFGNPADATDATRTVEIAASDDFAFDPAELKVTAGETVTFRIVNHGNQVHDFTLGDQTAQDEHEAEMAEMEGMAHDQPNVVTIPAGETKELTWTFTEAGTVLFGCHQPGHYAGGMKGEITIEA